LADPNNLKNSNLLSYPAKTFRRRKMANSKNLKHPNLFPVPSSYPAKTSRKRKMANSKNLKPHPNLPPKTSSYPAKNL